MHSPIINTIKIKVFINLSVADKDAILLLVSAFKCGLTVTKSNGMVNDTKQNTRQTERWKSPSM
jgi:hypothetical protein